mgnify:CR=1 FL=1
MFSKELYQKYLHTKTLGCELIFQPQTNSTNEDAWEYTQNSSGHGSLFITDNQTGGKGRRNNKWVSTPDKSLTFSFILHSELELEKMGLLPLLTGISIVRGITAATAIRTGLKWPNDIILNDKKKSGIIVYPKTWIKIKFYSKNNLTLVLCSHEYDNKDYIKKFQNL